MLLGVVVWGVSRGGAPARGGWVGSPFEVSLVWQPVPMSSNIPWNVVVSFASWM